MVLDIAVLAATEFKDFGGVFPSSRVGLYLFHKTQYSPSRFNTSGHCQIVTIFGILDL